MKQIHKFTTIIFGVSILAAVIGLSLTALIYSRTMNELRQEKTYGYKAPFNMTAKEDDGLLFKNPDVPKYNEEKLLSIFSSLHIFSAK